MTATMAVTTPMIIIVANNLSYNNNNGNPNTFGGPVDTTDICKPQDFEINFSLDKVKSTKVTGILRSLAI